MRSLFARNRDLVVIVTAYLIVNAALCSVYGVRVVNDSARYLEYASNLRHGFYMDRYNVWYISYVLFIFLIKGLTDYNGVIIGSQYVLGLLAAIALYKASCLTFKNARAALVSTLLLILFIDIPTWNSYVLTESLYVSCICFSLWGLASINSGPCTYRHVILVGALVIFTSFIKPTGISLMGAVIVVAVFRLWKKNPNKLFRAALVTTVGLAFLSGLNVMLSNYLVLENYRLGEVVYAVTTVTGYSGTQYLIVRPPDNCYVPPPDLPVLVKMMLFYLHHPFYSLKLFLAKAFFLLAHVRPFWSIGHNVLSLIVLIPSYALAARAIIKQWRQEKNVMIFSSTYMLIQILSVCLTSEDWDGRFLMPILPVIFLLTGAALITTRTMQTAQ